MTLEELTQEVDRDKSTVFRSLQKLVALGICVKETKTIKEGGLYHIYSAIDIESFKLETEKRIKELEKSFHRILRKFEGDMQTMISDFYQSNGHNNNNNYNKNNNNNNNNNNNEQKDSDNSTN